MWKFNKQTVKETVVNSGSLSSEIDSIVNAFTNMISNLRKKAEEANTAKMKKEDEKRVEKEVREGFFKVIKAPCHLLVLDEILGLADLKIVTVEEIRRMLSSVPENMTVICTGRVLNDRLRDLADEIYNIAPEK
mgnify:CR=1 FL=1